MSTFLMAFDEFGHGLGLPSIKTMISNEPYEGKDEIISYLQAGKKTYASSRVPIDVISNEKIGVEETGMTDGEYTWISTLPYYVEKYNLRLPKEFEKKALKK